MENRDAAQGRGCLLDALNDSDGVHEDGGREGEGGRISRFSPAREE